MTTERRTRDGGVIDVAGLHAVEENRNQRRAEGAKRMAEFAEKTRGVPAEWWPVAAFVRHEDRCRVHDSGVSGPCTCGLQVALDAFYAASLPSPAERDRERLDWLEKQMHAVDFGYDVGDGELGSVVIFRWPRDARVGSGLRQSIDAAVRAASRVSGASDA